LTRTLIAIASALLAALPFFASRAEACISCEYVPSVVHSAPAKSYGSERSAPRYEKRTREVVRERREKKKSRVTETKRPDKVEKADKPEKTEKATKVTSTEKATPAVAAAEGENSSFALSTRVGEPVPAKTETPGDRGTQHSTIATAPTSETSTGSVEANAVDKVSTGSGGATCSRYFPTVGQTLRVPCDQ
jgi:hypothetical protein